MHRILPFLLFVVVGCLPNPSVDRSWFQENDQLKILTTIAMIHDLVQEIGGEYVHSIPLIRGELDPHSYELVKGDDEKFVRADLIFFNGLGLEHGLSLRQNLENNPKAISVSHMILEQDAEAILIVDGQYDPHIWMDISLWMQTVDPIVKALCAKDAAHAHYFQERALAMKQKMQDAHEKIYRKMQAIASEKRYLVTSHDAFNYFTRSYLANPSEEDWRLRCTAPEGLAPEAQMSVSDVIAVISHVGQFGITVIFPESNVSPDSLKKIVSAANEKGLSIRLCTRPLYGDAMGDASSYLEMITHNAEVIAEELNR